MILYNKDIDSSEAPSRSKEELRSKLNQMHFYLGNPKEDSFLNEHEIFKGREVLIDTDLNKTEELICTTYFNSKPNPQKERESAKQDDINYIKPWRDSVHELNLQGVVFHDGLSEEFIEKYTTKNVRFVKCKIGDLSLNDERFIIYYMFLLRIGTSLKKVFFTDGNDVVIQRNPFEYIESFDKEVIFVGRNDGNRIRQSRTNLIKLDRYQRYSGFQFPKRFLNQATYNAGLLGGSTEAVLLQIRTMCQFFSLTNKGNNNMLLFNYAIYLHWMPKTATNLMDYLFLLLPKKLPFWLTIKFPKFYSGENIVHDNTNDQLAISPFIHTSYPFCSPFKKFQKSKEFIFLHK